MICRWFGELCTRLLTWNLSCVPLFESLYHTFFLDCSHWFSSFWRIFLVLLCLSQPCCHWEEELILSFRTLSSSHDYLFLVYSWTLISHAFADVGTFCNIWPCCDCQSCNNAHNFSLFLFVFHNVQPVSFHCHLFC